jgi:hypothetical protein
MFAAFQALYDCQDNNRYSYTYDRCSNVTLIQAGGTSCLFRSCLYQIKLLLTVYNVREVSLEGKQRKLAYDYLPLFDDYSYYYLPVSFQVTTSSLIHINHNGTSLIQMSSPQS